MAYFGCYLVNPNVQTFQNMYGKGGKWVLKAELQAAEVDPHFEKKCVFAAYKRTSTFAIFKISLPKQISVGS